MSIEVYASYFVDEVTHIILKIYSDEPPSLSDITNPVYKYLDTKGISAMITCEFKYLSDALIYDLSIHNSHRIYIDTDKLTEIFNDKENHFTKKI